MRPANGEFVPEARATQARLGSALFAYMLAITFLVTLIPFQFSWPDRWYVLLYGQLFDTAANVVLFVPLGFLYRMSNPDLAKPAVVRVMLLGAAISASIEFAQLFESARQTSLVDIVANASGAAIGAAAFGWLSGLATADERVVGLLSLELPLMGLLYLLLPLLWASSLASDGDAVRAGMSVTAGVFGALLLGGLQRHHFGPRREVDPRHAALLAAAWFLAGAFPLLAWHPVELALAAAGLSALCWWQGRRPLEAAVANRRFEVPLLRTAAPVYALYFLLLLCVPFREGLAEWSFRVGFPVEASDRTQIVRLLEVLAASTLIGYMAAEWRGRTVIPYIHALPGLAAWGLGLAVVTEAARGFQHGYGASFVRAAMLLATVLYGGWLYYLQRAHIVRLLARREAADARPDATMR